MNNRRLSAYVTIKEAVFIDEISRLHDRPTSEILRDALRQYLITCGKLKLEGINDGEQKSRGSNHGRA